MTDMKAARVNQWGGSDAVQVENIPRPEPAADEVLIRVRAAGINPVDWKTRQGYLSQLKTPITLGWDVAGDIVSVGADVQAFRAGDAVYAFILARGGAFAEYATTKVEETALKPASLDYVQAASVPAGALTAWQTLVDNAQVSAGQRVLIHAAAGGVGMFAVQIAKLRGAHVIATASSANENFVRELGADEFIDYRTTRFEDVAHDVDVVLNTIADDTLERSYAVIKRGGVLVSIAGAVAQDKAAAVGIRVVQGSVRPNRAQLTEIARLIDAGSLKTVVSEVVPLDEMRKALDLSETGHVRGKIVLHIAD